MMKFYCSECEIPFGAPDIDAFCPSCGSPADFWDWAEDESYWPEDSLADAEVFASVGWGTDEDYSAGTWEGFDSPAPW